ncbi:hypothetical protein ZMO1_ZMO2072 [Zymomonas mobilis subsp. mobilis ZM4 = ATCC 31821]|nr:hypothetical protein B9T50_07865 [Zymomonas mobilis subsp. mobilis]QIZ64080.1 hypothetical protein ZMO1_ZMO2072 [Zymomonas mobilis subsp. mobilis ZM4 = ATCC 31821]HCE36813.1 hypothetical protein [Zymomonas mobilis]
MFGRKTGQKSRIAPEKEPNFYKNSVILNFTALFRVFCVLQKTDDVEKALAGRVIIVISFRE